MSIYYILMCAYMHIILCCPIYITYFIHYNIYTYIGKYKGPSDCIIQIIKNEGIAAFYTGLAPTLFRNCIWNTMYFGTMHIIKRQLPKVSLICIIYYYAILYYITVIISALFLPSQPCIYIYTIITYILLYTMYYIIRILNFPLSM